MPLPVSVLLGSAHDLARLRREPLEHHSAPEPSDVLTVNGLLRHSQLASDVLPGPAEGASPIDLQRLELLDEPTQSGHCSQALARVVTPYVTS